MRFPIPSQKARLWRSMSDERETRPDVENLKAEADTEETSDADAVIDWFRAHDAASGFNFHFVDVTNFSCPVPPSADELTKEVRQLLSGRPHRIRMSDYTRALAREAVKEASQHPTEPKILALLEGLAANEAEEEPVAREGEVPQQPPARRPFVPPDDGLARAGDALRESDEALSRLSRLRFS